MFRLLVVLIIAGAVVRSAIATRLDDFTMDEAYHLVAGVSYVQRGDFRVNPEHPPLVKLWVGTVVSSGGFRLSVLRRFQDKGDERDFVNEDVYRHNDPDVVQRHARYAMFALNSLLLAVFTLAMRNVFGPTAALGTVLFLAIDPTVAAHLPVVMTDLPVALLCGTAVLLTARAFVDWRGRDLAACSVVLGLALATKHSAPVFGVFLATAGLFLTFLIPPSRPSDTRAQRLAKLAIVLLGAVIVLWTFYGFRFTESTGAEETFNRPLAAKIADLRSPVSRSALTAFTSARLLPRAYLWGLADTLRGGVEGRIASRLVWGRPFFDAPSYFFPAVVVTKLPLGLGLLVLMGLILFAAGRLPRAWRLPITLVTLAATAFFLVLARGAGYAGVRHALPAVVLLSVFAGLATHAAWAAENRRLLGVVVLALVGAAASALPVLRPWEYYNELVGGGDHAYLYFNDEGVDMFQRLQEVARYYHEVLEPRGDIPFLQYVPYDQEGEYLGLDWVGRDIARDEGRFHDPVFSGTVIVQGKVLGPRLYLDSTDLRAAKPVARFGNALVFQGSYNIAPILADDRYYRGTTKLFAEEPDLAEAERLFRQAAALDPSAFYYFIEVGNLCVRRRSREEAVQAYSAARDHAPAGTVFRAAIEDHLRLLETLPLEQVPELRDPALE